MTKKIRKLRVGIEVGGTFTDLVAFSESETITRKVPSTPASPNEGAAHALESAGIKPSEISELLHGSTVATNAILERKGAKVCFLVSKGIRDVLLLQRHTRRRVYDIDYQKPKHVVNREDIYEIDERISFDGSVINALNPKKELKKIQKILSSNEYEAVAICCLHSYVDPSNEYILKDLVRKVCPNIPIACSSDIANEFREYERASTVTMSAYVQPVITNYINKFLEYLGRDGFVGQLSLMQSNGGLIPAQAMMNNSITALFSGPAAGVVGSVEISKILGYQNLITFDMGGTSTDVSLIDQGKLKLAPITEIDGLPIKTPVVDIATVGAGGGSISWIDDGNLLRVGPESAGANPGPACYQRGGSLPTVTDAHLIKGTIRPKTFLGGEMILDQAASVKAFQPLADRLKVTVQEIADSTLKLAEASIVRAIQKVSTELGKDPRDYALVGFGGAGPLHAARIAEDLDINTVIIPMNAGLVSAHGLLLSDHVHYRTKTHKLIVNEQNISVIRANLNQLAIDAVQYLKSAGISGQIETHYTLTMRYLGQAFEISIDFQDFTLKELSKTFLISKFEEQHKLEFNFLKQGSNQIEIVTFRAGAKALNKSKQKEAISKKVDLERNNVEQVQIWDNGKTLPVKLTNREGLQKIRLKGPYLIDDANSTIFVPSGWESTVDKKLNLILSRRN